MNTVPVKRESLTEQIQTILIDRIVEGTLSPGDRLKELQIAKEFGTSQAPVRETIRSLQALGYVEHKPHVGAVVKDFTRKEIEEAYQIREALEGHCLALESNILSELTGKLKVHLKAMETAVSNNDITSFTKADNLFHRTIIECSQNNRMLEIWESLKIQMQIIATHVEAAITLDKLYKLHEPIVRSLEKGLREESKNMLSTHYKEVGSCWNTASDS